MVGMAWRHLESVPVAGLAGGNETDHWQPAEIGIHSSRRHRSHNLHTPANARRKYVYVRVSMWPTERCVERRNTVNVKIQRQQAARVPTCYRGARSTLPRTHESRAWLQYHDRAHCESSNVQWPYLRLGRAPGAMDGYPRSSDVKTMRTTHRRDMPRLTSRERKPATLKFPQILLHCQLLILVMLDISRPCMLSPALGERTASQMTSADSESVVACKI